MPHDDPTDNALAAIASILDQTTTPPGPAKAADNPPATVEEPPPPVDEEAPAAVTLPPPLPQADEPTQSEPEPSEAEQIQPIEAKVQPIEANGYSKTGPGPMAALRFRWTVREDGGRYYVDETFGEGSTPLVNGPMDGNAAIKFVDDREAAARQRFEHFKQDMISRTAPAGLVPRDDSEA
ncbi:hypothetical protein MTX26_17840 [Bradyrhizobium sp. ISRA443]|uniref:hypothetical protein n=1 Tax=unclassified Bradyrhizobium TaxID=2631580 RepID=UPI00247B03E4|nr:MULTISPECIES: hypothetical protein [unclassified Bradyrhizobium]WGR96355.1 hypothetical protein MTX23_17850 [Bradyrhizobium sp. ISRA436]WGS03240.1 hypothetical protein MTX18_17840 [Bradyrhizobium sp. ISRA437]WGS10124.1 hypothetical protein MTX26_17840 [Bradyrhizobium sp. ISRA443]